MKKLPLVSIIIPVRKINHFLIESMTHFAQLRYQQYEILIISDKKDSSKTWQKTKIIASGKVGPAIKRDLSIIHAKGEILAFIDDDAYPSPEWLNAAISHFTDPKVVAVGGPGVTPPTAPFLEQASGWVSASPLGSGPYLYRFLPMKKRLVDDYPSMNLLVRKRDFESVGGFDSNYYPGEDTKLCLDLIQNGKKIVYEPKAIVYHHRRPLWLPHLKQNGQFGIHRGHFARILPKTSFRLSYVMPSATLLMTICFVFAIIFNLHFVTILTGVGLSLYVLLLLLNAIWIAIISKNIKLALISLPAVVVTHLWYGIKFLQGYFFTKHLRS